MMQESESIAPEMLSAFQGRELMSVTALKNRLLSHIGEFHPSWVKRR